MFELYKVRSSSDQTQATDPKTRCAKGNSAWIRSYRYAKALAWATQIRTLPPVKRAMYKQSASVRGRSHTCFPVALIDSLLQSEIQP